MWHPACRNATGPFFKLAMPLPEDNSNTHDSSLASTSDDMPTATLAILPLQWHSTALSFCSHLPTIPEREKRQGNDWQ